MSVEHARATSVVREAACDDLGLPLQSRAVSLAVLAPAVRCVVRLGGPPAVLGAAVAEGDLESIAGYDLSMALNRWTGDGGALALRLGPDEWMVMAPESAERTAITGVAPPGVTATRLADALSAALTGTGRAHAIVDVSHRFVGLLLSGAAAAQVLAAGCPLDLGEAAFPPGHATRTVMGKAEIVLARLADGPDGDAHYRIEVARSFAAYLVALLAEAAREHLEPLGG